MISATAGIHQKQTIPPTTGINLKIDRSKSYDITGLTNIRHLTDFITTRSQQDHNKIATRSQQHKKETKMATVHIGKAEFLKKVFDYEKNPQAWKFEGSKPAIVDFYATWCGPCKALGPVLEEVSEEYGDRLDIYKVDVDKEQELSGVFGIRSVPTLLFIPKEGQPTMSSGAPSKMQLKDIIEKHLL